MALIPPPNVAGIPPPANPQDPPILSDINNSKEYVERLSDSKKSQAPGAATDDEIGSAERYHHELVLTHSLMGVALPQWVDQVRESVERIEARLERINARLELMNVQQTNARIGRLNNLELSNNVTYRAKQKEVAGDGTLLANTLRPQGVAPLMALQQVPAIGDRIDEIINPHALTHLTILQLIQFYNLDFGIQPVDLVPVRSQKISNWLTMDV